MAMSALKSCSQVVRHREGRSKHHPAVAVSDSGNDELSFKNLQLSFLKGEEVEIAMLGVRD